MHLSPKPIRIR